jgi:uncharacterized membrane protein YbhN (UPF0104 family)
VTLASFLVSHVTPFGSATGTLLNVSALEAEGVAASTTTEGIGLTSLVSTVALIALFETGFVATAGRHLSRGYLIIAGVALALVVAVLAIVITVEPNPGIAERAGRRVARLARRVRSSIDPDEVGRTSRRLASLTRSALAGRAFAESFGFASADLLFDLLSLDLTFAAAYLRLRLSQKTGKRAKPATAPPGNQKAVTYLSITGRYWPAAAVSTSTGIDTHRKEYMSCSNRRPPR